MADKPLPLLPSQMPKKASSQGTSARLPSQGTPPKTWWDSAVDAVKTVPSALVRGTVGMAGLPGDIRDLGDAGIKKTAAATLYLANQIAQGRIPGMGSAQAWGDAKSQTDKMVDRAKPLLHSVVGGVMHVPNLDQAPTSSQMVDSTDYALKAANKAVTGTPYGLYKPQTGTGRVMDTVVSSLPAAAVMGPESLMANLAKNAPVAVASGLGQGAAVEAVGPDSPYAPTAGLLGSLAAGSLSGLTAAARNFRSPAAVTERAENIAGQVRREASLDPEKDAAKLAAYNANPPPVMAGIEPTTAQVIRTPQEQALASQIASLGQKEGIGSTANAAEGSSKEILSGGIPFDVNGTPQPSIPQLAGRTLNPPDMKAAFGIEPNVQGEASSTLAETIKNAEQSYKRNEQAAWGKVDKDASLYGPVVLNDLSASLDALSVARAKRFPSEVRSMLGELSDQYGTKGSVQKLPIQQIQDLRSVVLDDARSAYASGDYTKASDLSTFADRIAGHLENEGNFSFDSKSAPKDWREAVDATRTYKEHFGNGIAKDITTTDRNGVPMIAPEAVMDKVLGKGTNAVQAVRRLRAIPGIDRSAIDQAVTDWHLGKLTKNGTDFTPTAVKLAEKTDTPQFQALAGEIPQLGSKREELLQAAGLNDHIGGLQKTVDNFHTAFNSGNPGKLANFLDTHIDDLKATTEPENAAFLDQLHNSAKFLSAVPGGGMMDSVRTLDYLKKGNLLSLLYGKAAGTISDAAGLAVLGEAAQQASHILGGTHWGAALGAGMSLAHRIPLLERGINRAILGNTREEAIDLLQRAARDPELAEALSHKPSPEAVLNAAKAMSSVGIGAAKLGVYSAVRPEEHLPPEAQDAAPQYSVLDNNYDVPEDATGTGVGDSVLDNNYDVPVRFAGGRVGFATGGSTGNIEPLVGRLMAKAEQAKRVQAQATEPLLNEHDNAIAGALRIANGAI